MEIITNYMKNLLTQADCFWPQFVTLFSFCFYVRGLINWEDNGQTHSATKGKENNVLHCGHHRKTVAAATSQGHLSRMQKHCKGNWDFFFSLKPPIPSPELWSQHTLNCYIQATGQFKWALVSSLQRCINLPSISQVSQRSTLGK